MRAPLAVALVAALALAGCGSGGEPAATPAPAPSTTTSPPGTPTPAPTVAEPAHTIGVLGDWGVDAPDVRQVVALMKRWKAEAVFTTGDNAYCCGTAAQSRFAKSLLVPLRVPIHPALGNHDVVTRDGIELMRAFGMTKRWYTVEVGPVQLVVLDSTRTSDPEQLAFLEAVLDTPRPGSFRVVLFHHPAWSCSAHDPDEGVRTRWLPLFHRDVDLVLAGHNHTYERFRGARGVPYVTTGGGGASLYPSARLACRGAGSRVFLRTVHHAVRLTATATTLRLEAIGVDGRTFDTITVAHR